MSLALSTFTHIILIDTCLNQLNFILKYFISLQWSVWLANGLPAIHGVKCWVEGWDYIILVLGLCNALIKWNIVWIHCLIQSN